MKTQRICNVWSLIINLSIVYFTISGVAYNFRTDVIIDDPLYGFVGWASLKFFTNLSNILVALASLILLFYNIRNIIKNKYEYADWALKLKYCATVAVAVTFVTVVLFLSPANVLINGKTYWDMFLNNGFFLHFFTPVLAIISFVFFEKIQNFRFCDALWGVLPVLLYALVYFLMVMVVGNGNGGWPDFYGFTFGGSYIATICSCIVMLSATWALSLGIRWLQGKSCLLSEHKGLKKAYKKATEEDLEE